MFYDQSEFELRCEWGEQGVAQLAPISDVVIIVDVLSFTTCVEIATSRGAVIYPYRSRDESAQTFADSVKAELAGKRHGDSPYLLSPASLLEIPRGTRLVLPSPNGSTLSLATGSTPALAGCLRNAREVAFAAQQYGERIAIIPAGERWRQDGSLRPALEDWIGAGAILEALDGKFSPEAQAARDAFRAVKSNLKSVLLQSGSGKELIARNFEPDVTLSSMLNMSDTVPRLRDGAFTA